MSPSKMARPSTTAYRNALAGNVWSGTRAVRTSGLDWNSSSLFAALLLGALRLPAIFASRGLGCVVCGRLSSPLVSHETAVFLSSIGRPPDPGVDLCRELRRIDTRHARHGVPLL